jgi:hypothetical protein
MKCQLFSLDIVDLLLQGVQSLTSVLFDHNLAVESSPGRFNPKLFFEILLLEVNQNIHGLLV